MNGTGIIGCQTTSPGDALKRRALLVLAMTAAVLAGCAQEPPPVSEKVQAYLDSHKSPTLGVETATPKPVKLDPALIQPGVKTVFFGDSWTGGYASKPSSGGFAYKTGDALGLSYKIEASSGTGYVNPGNAVVYAERMKSLPGDPAVKLLVIQGGLNDESSDQSKVPDAAKATIVAAKAKFPAATIVMVGPATSTLPVSDTLHAVDRSLHAVAGESKIAYISPLDESWITDANYASVIDTSALNHPSTEGHAYLAGKLVADLKALVS